MILELCYENFPIPNRPNLQYQTTNITTSLITKYLTIISFFKTSQAIRCNKYFQCDVETATGVYSCLSVDMMFKRQVSHQSLGQRKLFYRNSFLQNFPFIRSETLYLLLSFQFHDKWRFFLLKNINLSDRMFLYILKL